MIKNTCKCCGQPLLKRNGKTYERLYAFLLENGATHRHYANIARAMGEKYPENIKYNLEKLKKNGLIEENGKIITLINS